MRKAALFPDEANHIPDVLGQETGCVCPRLGTSPPVSCPFPARLPRMQAELHCPQHCGKSSTRTIRDNRPGEVSQVWDTFTRSICPFTRSICPYLTSQPGTVRPGAYVPDLGHRPRSPVPFLARSPRMQAELHCPQHCGKSSTRSSDGGVPYDTGQQTGGSVPSLGHVHPVNLSLHPVSLSLPPGQFVPYFQFGTKLAL